MSIGYTVVIPTGYEERFATYEEAYEWSRQWKRFRLIDNSTGRAILSSGMTLDD